jgi:hypothetical protein
MKGVPVLEAVILAALLLEEVALGPSHRTTLDPLA